jgi:hypothetical protein
MLSNKVTILFLIRSTLSHDHKSLQYIIFIHIEEKETQCLVRLHHFSLLHVYEKETQCLPDSSFLCFHSQ